MSLIELNLSNIFEAVRAHKRVTRARLARELGIPRQRLQRLATSRSDYPCLIARLFKVSNMNRKEFMELMEKLHEPND